MNISTTHPRPDGADSALRLAVLIDADNAQAAVIEGLLAEVARFGVATVKRIYGDFTAPTSASWKKVLQEFAIKPVQQFAYTKGKNATDSTMIIDAMDLLYTRNFDGFCLVSSDSDFTGLAMRLREEGLTVFGFGEEKTPEAFRNACHKFILTEVLRKAEEESEPAEDRGGKNRAKKKAASSKGKAQSQGAAKKYPALPKRFIVQALEQSSDDDGWADLGNFGNYLSKLKPDFDPRVYGFRKLSDLVKAHAELFLTEERKVPDSNRTRMVLKVK